MADIREHYEGQGDNSFLRARSSERMQDKIDTQERFESYKAEQQERAEQAGIPVWLQSLIDWKSGIYGKNEDPKIYVASHGIWFYAKDGKHEMSKEAMQFARDGMLLSDFLKLAILFY
jgi:hypothetical protein